MVSFGKSSVLKTAPPHGRGSNGLKRRRRAAFARLKGCPGGWKKAVRQLQALERERARC